MPVPYGGGGVGGQGRPDNASEIILFPGCSVKEWGQNWCSEDILLTSLQIARTVSEIPIPVHSYSI